MPRNPENEHPLAKELNHTLVNNALDVAKARTLRKAPPIGMATKT